MRGWGAISRVFAFAAAALSASATLIVAPPASGQDADKLPPRVDRAVDFVKDVQPIFAASCLACHGEKKQKSNYRLDSRGEALGGGDIGGAIVPGKSADSPLIHYVAGLDEGMLMPAEGPRLSAEQIGVLRAWIDQGAAWPESAEVRVDRGQHWSLAPLVMPPLPTVKDASRVRTPIDAFVQARLEARGMTMSPPAEKRLLLRRVYFDLIGLPPTPEELDAFLADESPEAYERVVERLLASPRYGERWARHWMDVVHFAETHGNDQDRERPNAWPYRDYLIAAFNGDKPYARFVAEQLAGDVLYPEDGVGIVATGFIAAGPWDESSQLNIVDDTVDKKIARNLDRDDMLTATLATFMSQTIQCARCHNHKFDPITQVEYYRLQSVFAGVDRANRPYDADPRTLARRRELERQKIDLETRPPSADVLADPALASDVAAWEKQLDAGMDWTPLKATSIATSDGSTWTEQGDGSLLFHGPRPDKETYTITIHTDLMGMTAIRLELLSDESLPQKGPGRQDNGNLHLNEFKLRAGPKSNPDAGKSIRLRNATADFNQTSWSVEMAIDDKPGTAWGIHPEVGKSHVGVFETAETIGFEGGTTLVFTLEQTHGRGHLIGRLRLSATTAPPPVRAVPVAPEIAAILAVSPAARSDAQRTALVTAYLKLQIERELAALPPPRMVYAAASDFRPEGNFTPARTPRPIHLLKRGDVNSPGDEVSPAGLACVPGLDAQWRIADTQNEGSRRAALAQWITDRNNVLTWRSIVNRVWHYHFGHGIADSPNDLGRMGSPPTHPELIDWLATTFRDGGGSLKQLHRTIVSSYVYRQSSAHNAGFAEIDAENRYLWRMHRARLDAESVRDAALLVTGKLDTTMGGPSVKQFQESPGIHVTPNVDYRAFDVDSPGSYRRSVYRFLFRTLPDPFMESMDCADSSQLVAKRASSVTALQALAMLNNRFIVRQSEHFAARVAASHGDARGQVEAVFRLALLRAPSAEETEALADYAQRHGLANLCRLIFNCNEFMFVN